MNIGRRLACSATAWSLVLGAHARAASPAPTQEQRAPVFKASVDVVPVDVSVVGSDGSPVRDLTAEDFVLTVDGKPRKIVSVQFISATSTAEAPVEAPTGAYYSSNITGVTGRLIAIVVDRGNIQPIRSKDVFAAASRFVSRLSPADQVALVSIPSGPRIDFTTDHLLVQSALDKMDGEAIPRVGAKGIGLNDALKMERGDPVVTDEVFSRECGNVGQSELLMCRRLVKEEASLVAADMRQRTRNTVGGLRAILQRLGSSETPKTVVFVSEGLVVERERTDLTWVAAAAAAAHVTIHVLQPDPAESDASQNRPPAGLSLDRTLRSEGLDTIAHDTRGEVFRIVADPNLPVDRLARELSGYYLLGFEAEAADRDGKAHHIKVDVRGGKVRVRPRPQFTAGPTAAATPEQEIAATLRTPILSNGIPLRLTTYVFQDPASAKLRVLMGTEVNRSASGAGPIAFGYMLVDSKGKVVVSRFEPAIAGPRDGARLQPVFGTLVVDPGEYTLKVAVIDEGGRRGSVERRLSAVLTRLGQLRVTDLLIADGAGAAQGGTMAPTIGAEFSGDMLNAYLELSSDVPDLLRSASVTIEVASTASSATLDSAPAGLQTPAGDEKTRAAGAAVPIALLPPGEYIARAVISVSGRKVGQVIRPFRIVRPRSG